MSGVGERIDRLVATVPLGRYVGALVLVFVTVAIRAVLDPFMVGGLGMAFFYPAVILSAYWLGVRPAIFTAVLSTISVLGFQIVASGALLLNDLGKVILILFIVTSALAIYLIGAIRSRLSELSERHDRTEALVNSQASLFRDHAERVTNHLQLIAAILEFRADAEGEQSTARLLSNAASRTLLISRMHREFAGAQNDTINFAAFARRLAAASDAERQVEVLGDSLDLPLEQATGLGLILLDRMNASLGPVVIELFRDADDLEFIFSAAPSGTASSTRELLLLEAVAMQLRGNLDLDQTREMAVLRLCFPEGLQPPPAWSPLGQAVH